MLSKEILLKKIRLLLNPLENILIECKGIIIKASPFKTTDNAHLENRKIIEQNIFVNQSLYTIGQQLDQIEEKNTYLCYSCYKN
jgi:predicted nucleotide-binding protein (sugar kinase/HSP70/actin superfamily)